MMVADTMGIVSTDHRDGTTKLPVGRRLPGVPGVVVWPPVVLKKARCRWSPTAMDWIEAPREMRNLQSSVF
jgi:hypothetical protein